ncbi:PREDICTED: formin-like protein 18 isoform X2 [Nelumbo nucifera]|uniref:Formin-like protein n=1 Tax=Nelumbo nucifera TaxID=4432 RepID=A0A1U8AIC8_NELNU|nr:PREDICTED: formin-like protein 18 isoform X2 [Nelumbo nucifera]
MALFRKFFYRKPPDGLLEISERIYVFDYCFSTDVLEEGDYEVYLRGIVGQIRDHFPDAQFMVFNFREGEGQSQIADILLEYDMTVGEYPRHYEGCPLLTMELIHHFLRSSESWLSLGQKNVLLMHCERGGWPVLAFMLAALLIYRKHYTGEQKTLDMIYKQAPRELLQLLSPLNPVPSQLRYLQYVSRRNVGSEWPPLDRALTLDCVMLRVIPNFDGEGGCRPIFRIYGQDPFMVTDQNPKVLFSTPKKSKAVRLYKQADCELVKIDIHCHIQGDVVLECINLDDDLEREEMMFRVMFNTAFIRSNILMLSRDEIDILWNGKDQFPKDYRAEILFSEMDAASSLITVDYPHLEEKEGVPMEAFAKIQEIFNNVDWLNPSADAAINFLQQIEIDTANILQDKLEAGSFQNDEGRDLVQEPSPEKLPEKLKPVSSENKIKSSMSVELEKQTLPYKLSVDLDSPKSKFQPNELHVAFQLRSPSKIITQRISPLSSPMSYNSPQGSPVAISRYHSAPSVLGITALLHDHSSDGSPDSLNLLVASPPCYSPSPKLWGSSIVSSIPPPPPPPSLLNPLMPSTTIISSIPPSPLHQHLSTSKSSAPSLMQDPGTSSSDGGQLSLASPSPPPPPPPPPPPSCKEASASVIVTVDSIPPRPPPVPPCLGSTVKNLSSVPPPPPPPPPFPSKTVSFALSPPPPPPPMEKDLRPKTISSAPSPPPPPPPLMKKTDLSSGPPPPPPPPMCSGISPGPTNISIAPPPPPPPGFSLKSSGPPLNNSPHVPPVPPPPAPFPNGVSRAGDGFPQSLSSGNSGASGVAGPPTPAPPLISFGIKGRGLSRNTSPRNQQKKSSLKPLHWFKLTRAMQGSLWDEISKSPGVVEMPELENLFSAAVSNSERGSGQNSSQRASAGPKSNKVHLIELRRAYNCEIMLSKVKIPLPDMMHAVLTLDESALDADQVDNLIKFCPTKEEMEQLKGYNGDPENLGKCEQFFLELMKVPRVESKLRVFSFKIQFRSQVSDLRNALNVVNSASEEIRNSDRLKSIMKTILQLGNALNQGTARGSAIGFRLDSLLKLSDTRARNNKMTLMHYLCKVLADKLPETIDFQKDLVSLEVASKIQLKYLAEEMQAISKGLEKVEEELIASENDGPVSQTFHKGSLNSITMT